MTEDQIDQKAEQEERKAKAEAIADKIVAQADDNGTPKFTMVGKDAEPAPEALPEPEKIMVPVEEAAAFVITCNEPNMIADAFTVCHRSLAQAVDQALTRLSQACGQEAITKLEDLDTKFPSIVIGLQYNMPTVLEPPAKDVTAVEVVQRQILAPVKPSLAITGILKRVIPVEAMMDAIVQLLITRASVSAMHMCAVTMIDKDGKVGGTVVSNPSIPPSAEQVTIMYETMKNHAEEFKRSCDKAGLRVNSLIIPSGAQVNQLTGKTGMTGVANQPSRGQRRK